MPTTHSIRRTRPSDHEVVVCPLCGEKCKTCDYPIARDPGNGQWVHVIPA